MRVIAKSRLKKFWGRPGCGDARRALHSWDDEAVKATWASPQDINDPYANASICGNSRVVFNIGGHKYRLVVEMQYRAGAWLKFVDTHAQYDRIDVENVNGDEADPKRRRPEGGVPPARVRLPGRGTNP